MKKLLWKIFETELKKDRKDDIKIESKSHQFQIMMSRSNYHASFTIRLHRSENSFLTLQLRNRERIVFLCSKTDKNFTVFGKDRYELKKKFFEMIGRRIFKLWLDPCLIPTLEEMELELL